MFTLELQLYHQPNTHLLHQSWASIIFSSNHTQILLFAVSSVHINTLLVSVFIQKSPTLLLDVGVGLTVSVNTSLQPQLGTTYSKFQFVEL